MFLWGDPGQQNMHVIHTLCIVDIVIYHVNKMLQGVLFRFQPLPYLHLLYKTTKQTSTKLETAF